MTTNDADNTNTVEVAGDSITVAQNVAYGQLPPGTDDFDCGDRNCNFACS